MNLAFYARELVLEGSRHFRELLLTVQPLHRPEVFVIVILFRMRRVDGLAVHPGELAIIIKVVPTGDKFHAALDELGRRTAEFALAQNKNPILRLPWALAERLRLGLQRKGVGSNEDRADCEDEDSGSGHVAARCRDVADGGCA